AHWRNLDERSAVDPRSKWQSEEMDAIIAVPNPLAEANQPIGRQVTLLADPDRSHRLLGVDCWYPATETTNPSTYELLPGIGFTSVAGDAAPPAASAHSLIVFSHGRSGNRLAYSQLCETLASHGHVVIAVDHPGDTMADWLLGTQVDDRTNERQRVEDLAFLLGCLLKEEDPLFSGLPLRLDRVVVAGHSYGAYTAFTFAGNHGEEFGVVGVMGFQPFLSPVERSALSSITAPVLLIGGACDTTTPVAIDIDEALPHLTSSVQTVVLNDVGHQGCSDVGLYCEVASTIDGIPEMVLQYLDTMAADVTGTAGDPWRPVLQLHLDHIEGFLKQDKSA
ncbi:MAG: alpha/beta fold hydrolase, partial [Actinomycetota bacterium]